jgi:tripartite-type tricarboxylate transporter receptor subunit TctC
MLKARLGLLVASTICGMALCGIDARAEYPDRTIHFLIGVAPGGSNDTLARLIADKLSAKWGQPVVVENREGASSTIAANLASRSPADGYTVLFVNNNHTVASSQMQLPYDPVKSFAPISLLVTQPDALVVNPSVPVNSLEELIAYAKAHPRQLNFGASGIGGAPYLDMLILMQKTGMQIAPINYKGSEPVLIAVLANEVQMMFGSAATVAEQVKIGKLKALAVSAKVRSPVLPEVPTIAEAANLPDFDQGSWVGALAPAGTPQEIVSKLRDGMVEAMEMPDVKKVLVARGIVPVESTPEEFGAFMGRDIPFWTDLLKSIDTKKD